MKSYEEYFMDCCNKLISLRTDRTVCEEGICLNIDDAAFCRDSEAKIVELKKKEQQVQRKIASAKRYYRMGEPFNLLKVERRLTKGS